MSGQGKPKVLLLGDSIRLSYQPMVKEMLQGDAKVVGPAENCQFSLHTLASLPRWLDELGEPDIVHWNNGLHDVGHNPDRSPVQIPVEIYRMTLDFILRALMETKAQVIWATSTPVHPKRPFSDDQWSWRKKEIDLYNSVALALMTERGVPINDLHTLVASDVDQYLGEDLIHLSEAGKELCARAVVSAIKTYLP